MEPSFAHRTLRNISYNFIGFALPIVFSVFVTPVVVHKLGVVDFGIYVLANTIGVFLTLADLGLSIALIKFVAEYNAKHDRNSMANLLNSANTLYLFIGLFGLSVYAVLGKWFLSWFKIGNPSQEHIFFVFLLSGIIFFVNAVNSVYTVVPQAMQRYDISNKVNLFQTAITNGSLLLLVVLGYKLKAIMLANLALVILITFVYRWYFLKLLPGIRLRFAWLGEEIKKAFSFGLLAATANLAVNSLAYVDRLIIPIFTGPAQLTYYSLPGNVAQKTLGVTNSLSGVLFPMASDLNSRGEDRLISSIYTRAFRNLTVVSAAMTIAISMFSYKILFFWLGESFAQKGSAILVVLAVSYYIASLYSPLYNFLLGMGRVKFLIASTSAMSLLNIVLVLMLTPKFGIMGAAWAYLLSLLPVAYIFIWVESRYLGLKNRLAEYARLYLKVLFTGAVFAVITKYLVLPWVNTFWLIILLGPLSVLLYLALYYLFGFFHKEDLNLVAGYVRKHFKKYER